MVILNACKATRLVLENTCKNGLILSRVFKLMYFRYVGKWKAYREFYTLDFETLVHDDLRQCMERRLREDNALREEISQKSMALRRAV